MRLEAVRELAAAYRSRYLTASRPEKSRILDEFCRITGYHRKSANRLLLQDPDRRPKQRRGRPPVYRGGALVSVLLTLWEASGFICSKYLKAVLPLLMTKLEQKEGIVYGEELRSQLLSMSASTIDRLLRPHRDRRLPHRYIGRRVASDLSHKIAVHTFAELRDLPVGHVEIDLVLHCGMTTKAFFLTTLVAVETISSWTICIPVWGKGKERVQGAIVRMRKEAPFELKGIHSDNGVEFINETLYQYTQKEGLEFSHSRPYHKNDQPRVEQRNGSLVRRLVGYGRYSSKDALASMERVYALGCAHANFFRPTTKLLSSERHGARVAKRYDSPKTPYQRLLATGALTVEQIDSLAEQYAALNPLETQRQLTSATKALWAQEAVDPASERMQRLREAAAQRCAAQSE